MKKIDANSPEYRTLVSSLLGKDVFEDVPQIKMDPLIPLYIHFDFSITRIAGSFALQQFTKDFSWKPNDIDIVVFDLDVIEFKNYVKEFCEATSSSMVKFKVFSESDKTYKRYKSTSLVKINNEELLLQFVLIDSENKSIEERINSLCDVPSCISYKVIDGLKYFVIPEKAIESIINHRVDKKYMDNPSRILKYQERGYTFY